MSFTLRPFASAALLLSMAGLCAGTLLAAEQTEPSEASAVRARPLVLGVVETAEPSFDDNTVRPVLKAMQSAAPGTQIDVVRLSSATFEVAVAQLKPDLVISPAADFLRIVDSIGAHPIGTRKTKYAKHPSKSADGAVIALASRTDIQKLTDLRGKYIAATLPTSVDGMLAVRMELAVHVMRHGAVDFLEKPVEPMTLVQRVAQCVTASLSAKADDAAADEVRRRFDRLTPREREVIDGVLKNAPNKIIARTLGIELSTVKMHRANAFAKLGVHSPGELLKMAYEAGIVSSAASAAESSDAQAF